MERSARLLAALAVMILTTPLASAVAVETTVVIGDSLEPSALGVTPGTTVIWVNEDGERHRIRSQSGPEEFDSGNLDSGETFSFNFALEGTYTYVDDRDPADTAYHGTITVAADAEPPDPGDPPPPPPTTGDVSIVDRSFQPGSITVGVGATVTWANNDGDEHTVTANDGSFDSGIFDAGQTYARTFDAAGTIPYFCIIHPDMVGTVVVVDDTGEPPPPPPPPPPPEPPVEPPPPPAPGAVNIVDFDFTPGALTVAAGSTVTWSNVGAAPHTVTAGDASFDSGIMFAGDTFSRTFDAAGSYEYFCALHPEMVASIVVTGADGTPPPEVDPVPPPEDPVPDPGAPSPTVPVGGIAIVDNAFQPSSRTITTGTTVVWTNTGAVPHTVTATGGGFDSGLLFAGDSYRRTFTQPGVFEYLCILHPGMGGTIRVTGEPTAEPPDAGPGSGVADLLETDGDAVTASGPSTVSIIDNAYSPERISVPAGSTVRWANDGALPHTVTARDGAFDSGILMAADAYAKQLTKPGTYEYFCTIHPEMVGTIEVTEATGPIEVVPEDEATAPTGEPPDATAERAEAAELMARNVLIVDNGYEPRAVTVEVGQPVRWVNRGAIPHTVTDRGGGFDSGILAPGASFEQAFLAPGSYEYFCTLHPDMTAVVEVVAARPDVAAGAGRGAGASPGTAVAYILAGSIVASVAVFAFGMARFSAAVGGQRGA